MDENRKAKLDSFFEAFSVLAEGNYIYICDMKEDYSRWSKSAVDFFDLPDEYMYGAGAIWDDHIHPDDRESYEASINELFSGSSDGHNMQYRARARDGNYVVCTCKGVIIKSLNGEPEYFGGAIKNHGLLSYVDTVTGLRSMYGFIDDLKSLCWRQQKSSIIIIGMSRFSAINDMYGYNFGNSVLREFGNLLKSEFSNECTIYKIDGPKFAVISTTLDQDKLEEIYKQVKTHSTQNFYVDGEKIILSINGGMIYVDNFNLSPDTIFSCLKYSYYESKDRRLGEIYRFHNVINDDNKHFVEKLNTIRNSVAEGCKGFFLCYQPIINAENEELKGMEALLRWQNEEYGIVPPDQFIPVLEQDMIFPKLGNWILRQAMTDGLEIIKKYPNFIVNVNISYAQLQYKGFIQNLFALTEELGFPKDNLCLELTERCRLLDIDLLKSMFSQIKDNGVKIALDDFGTGFSSIGVLRVLDVDTIKVDREYVKNIVESKIDQQTVMCISNLAGAFSADLCAEGVETSQMRDILKQYNVRSYQGYYYSKPVRFEEFAKMYL
jgi:diguanylate cyclase (GGDEF)-like protein